MNTVACVLKSGVFKPWDYKDYTVSYGPEHVRWLRDQFAAKVTLPHQFVCLSDIEVPGVHTIPLRDNLPGWWSKMELFREFQRAFYVDLDVVLMGDISPYMFGHFKFAMSANMTRRHGVNSSVMSWEGDHRFLYERFIANKDEVMKTFNKTARWGDQDFIKETYTAVRGPLPKFQHKFPELIVSYKYDIMSKGQRVKPGARDRVPLRGEWQQKPRVVVFHGSPKPHQVRDPWVPPLCAG